MEAAVRADEKERLLRAVSRGAGAFEVSNMIAQLVQNVAKRTASVGARSVALLLPDEGFWDTKDNNIIGYLPRMIFQNGRSWGPSEFPVSLL
jgi:hypothetical protein